MQVSNHRFGRCTRFCARGMPQSSESNKPLETGRTIIVKAGDS
jgi:hypothetical protein